MCTKFVCIYQPPTSDEVSNLLGTAAAVSGSQGREMFIC